MTLTGPELVAAIRTEQIDPPAGIVTLGLDRTHEHLDVSADGRVRLRWAYDDRYVNTEGALLCTWIASLADQACFFATNLQCRSGESTRMRAFSLDLVREAGAGDLVFDAAVRDRAGDQFHCDCDVLDLEGNVMALFRSTIDIVR